MRTVEIPNFFHKLLGKKMKLVELIIILIFPLIASVSVLIATANEWQVLKFYQQIVLVILMLDIYGGVVANFTYSTNEQYSNSNKSRLIFLAIQVQPIVITLVLDEFLKASLIVWIITIVGALVVNACKESAIQQVIGGLIMVINIIIVILFLSYLPKFLLAFYIIYIIKLCFSFTVDHYSKR